MDGWKNKKGGEKGEGGIVLNRSQVPRGLGLRGEGGWRGSESEGRGLGGAVGEKSTCPSEGKSEVSEVESFFEALPRSFITRRRYSEFRPVPVPFPGKLLEEGDDGANSDSSGILASEEIEEKVGGVTGGQGQASDLELFLQGQLNKGKFKSNKTDQVKEEKEEIKGYSHELLAFVIVLCLFTLCQIITAISLFGIGDFIGHRGKWTNGTNRMVTNIIASTVAP